MKRFVSMTYSQPLTDFTGRTPCREQPGLPSFRASHPVGDIGGYLLGPWHVARRGWNGAPEGRMRFRGTASFSGCGAGLMFEECGMMTVGAYRGEAVRRYVFHIESASVAKVCFEDGRSFHRLDLGTGAAQVRHDCAPDRYEGRYRVLDPACWLLTWRVTGPRKNQVIASRFTRMTGAG